MDAAHRIHFGGARRELIEINKGHIMKIPLGIAVDATPTFGELFDRAVQRGELMAAGQELLKCLTDEAFIRGSRLEISEGRFQLSAKIPANPQADFIGHARNNPGVIANPLLRQDDVEQQAIDETVAGIENGARTLERVAEAMATLPSASLAAEVKKMEKTEGIDTKPARSFIYLKQDGFAVEVEDETIQFRAHAVRTAVADPESVELVMTRVQSRSESTVVRGLVHAAKGDGKYVGLQAGGTHEFRFVRLEGWQKVVLEAACWLELPVRLVASETVSTCTLEYKPADVHQVHNWPQLLADTLLALQRIRDAANDGRPCELRDAA